MYTTNVVFMDLRIIDVVFDVDTKAFLKMIR